MWDFFKGLLIEKKDENIKEPEFLGVFGLAIAIYKVVFKGEFEKITELILNDKSIQILQSILHFMLGTAFIIYNIVFLLFIVFMIIYVISNWMLDRGIIKSEKLKDSYRTIHRFFLGSKIKLSRINAWVLVIMIYYYIFNENSFYIYIDNIKNYFINSNIVIITSFTLYSLITVLVSLDFIRNTFYRLLYFTMDEETEKLLSRD
ncbi:hypothetical protein CDLVIII_5475 [Clostridium sp. DL-VIII]|uniref:hypothetical protein n=1 Tax=Clostridium sp. DL-VIII TaxID=641107 RepID=UPI00023B0509|nr:hypothetical protein [Clostridium sp. DL-VIII]EHJ01949.1 hypothetical protein CDLVIII_5475 [Clostridium sp. DL-VIII]